MDGSPRSSKRRRLNPSTQQPPINSHSDQFDSQIDIYEDTNELQIIDPPAKADEKEVYLSVDVDGANDTEGFEVYEDQDNVMEKEHITLRSARQQKDNHVPLNGVRTGRVAKRRSKTSTPQHRKERPPISAETAKQAHTPSKTSRSITLVSPLANGSPRGPTQNGARFDDKDSPPPSLTPSKTNRVWPRQYTNKGQREAELSHKTPDPVVASPQSMLGRLASTGKAIASRFRLAVNGVEPVSEQGVSLKDLDLTQPNRTPVKRKPAVAPTAPVRIEESEQGTIRNVVLEKLTGARPIPLVGLDDEYKKVYQVAEQTVTVGEGNSMLIIGARGSGKSAVMNKVLQEVARDNSADFHVIRLNGLIHTDDKLALREIWRQLGREMDVEDDGTGKSYADTLARLLALLSHPSELAGEETESIAKAVIFIMDEFDLFASHPRQTLLYNLFDIAQSRKAPIAVFGLTTRIDVAESLEKRVKSRFSHRYVHLCQAPNLPGFREVCRAALTVESDELSFEEKARLFPETPTSQAGTPSKAKTISPLQIWNATVNALLEEKNFLAKYVTPYLYLSKSVPTVLSNLHLPIAMAPATTLPLNPSHFDLAAEPDPDAEPVPQLVPPHSKLHLLPMLPTLTLSLLIAAARCTIIHDTSLLNFRIAYAEYASLASKARIASASSGALATGTRVWGREVARSCWEELLKLSLIIPAQGGLSEGVEAEVGEKGMVRVDVALEEIIPSCPGLEKGLEKWCRQI